MTRLLEVEGMQAGYDGLPVLFGVDLAIEPGEAVALLGRNGMGKTTTVRCIVGLTRPTAGAIRFEGRRIDRWTADRIGRAGIALVPENRLVFPHMSVAENLAAGAYLRHDHGEIANDIAKLLERFPVLKERRSQQAGTLSGGEQQMLAVARALMSRPRLQNAHMALQVAHKFFLMEQGKVTFSGTPGAMAEDDVIRRAYLGSAKAS